ncbi:hypothetical protein V6N13_081345 [Hibiscus sabdariffa]
MASSMGMIDGGKSWCSWIQIQEKGQKTARNKVRVHCSSSSSITDPYKTLRIQRGASESEIKKAFRQLALRCHPDVCRGSNGGVQFETIVEAYDILMSKLRGESQDSEAYNEEEGEGKGNSPEWDLWEEWMGWEGDLKTVSSTVAPSGPQALSRRKPPPPSSPGFHLFFFLTLGFNQGSPSSASVSSSSASSQNVEITYGTVLKLMHEKTKIRLHSHEVPYGSGSGQQSVTGFPNVDDSNSYWIVRPEPDTSAKQGDTIPDGAVIRLQHMRTRKWLHSHLFQSPISGNLEVSCFGGESESDTGDYWRLIIEGDGNTWKQDQRIRLQHIDTSGYLHSHDKKYSRIAGGQQEVCGIREKRAGSVWLAAEGVYLPITETKLSTYL